MFLTFVILSLIGLVPTLYAYYQMDKTSTELNKELKKFNSK